jgi:hypothetical protein
MLQSEAQVLQCQRQFYEAALAQLRATPGYGSTARFQQQQQQQQQPLHEAEQHMQGDTEEDALQGDPVLPTVQEAAAAVVGAAKGVQQLQVTADDSVPSTLQLLHQVRRLNGLGAYVLKLCCACTRACLHEDLQCRLQGISTFENSQHWTAGKAYAL